MSLKNKKILFIGIGFYDYEKIIQTILLQCEAKVDNLNSAVRPFFYRLLIRLHLSGLARCFLQMFQTFQIKRSIPDNDIVFIIKGEGLSQLDIDLLRKRNPHARFILYLWDSLVRHANKELLLRNFSDIWSFDRKDCEENPMLKFRPLFYREIFCKVKRKYKLSFIGWLHSERLNIVRQLRDQLRCANEQYYLKLYTGRFHYFLLRYIYRILKPEDKELIILKPLSYKVVQQVMAESEFVLDIAHPMQTGLTMRTIETLAMGAHLLTTNVDIMNYPEIDSKAYTILHKDCITIPSQIADVMPSQEFKEYFSIQHFISQLFEL